MIRVATDSTRSELQHFLDREKAFAARHELVSYISGESQYNMHSVRVRVNVRPGRNKKRTYYASLVINGRRYGFNAAVGFIEKS